MKGWPATWCSEVQTQTPQFLPRSSGKGLFVQELTPFARHPFSPWPRGQGCLPCPLGTLPPQGMRQERFQECPSGGRSQPPDGQTDRQTAGGTHLRNTEPGLSGAPCWASQALSGLPGASNLNSVSLEDRLFFTILHLSVARPRGS